MTTVEYKERRRAASDAHTEATRRLRAAFPDDYEQYRAEFRRQHDPQPARAAERLLRERRFYSFRTLYAEEAHKRGLRPRGAMMAYFMEEITGGNAADEGSQDSP